MCPNHLMYVSELSIRKNSAVEISNFGHFLLLFPSRLVRGSTCTRVRYLKTQSVNVIIRLISLQLIWNKLMTLRAFYCPYFNLFLSQQRDQIISYNKYKILENSYSLKPFFVRLSTYNMFFQLHTELFFAVRVTVNFMEMGVYQQNNNLIICIPLIQVYHQF